MCRGTRGRPPPWCTRGTHWVCSPLHCVLKSCLTLCDPVDLASLRAQLVRNLPTVQETPVGLLGREAPPEKGLAAHSSVLGFPAGSAGKESACNVGDLGSIPGLGRSPGEGKGHPPQCSGLESSVDRIVRGVSESGTPARLSLHLRCVLFLCLHCLLFLLVWGG